MVGAVHIDDVEAAVTPAARRLGPVDLHALYVVERHRLGHEARHVLVRELARSHGSQPRLAVQALDPTVEELDTRECPVRMHLFDGQAQSCTVALVPQVCRHCGRLVGVGRYRRVSDTHRTPAALGLHGPEGGLRPRLCYAKTRRVRHLVEAVRQGLRPDLEGLE